MSKLETSYAELLAERDRLREEVEALTDVLEQAEIFLHDFCNRAKCVPGALRRAILDYRKLK